MFKTLLAVAVFASWSPPLFAPEIRAIEFECNAKTCTINRDDFAWLVGQHIELLKQIKLCLKTREA